MRVMILLLGCAGCAPKVAPEAAQVPEPPVRSSSMFVGAEYASVCPTAEQALANACGHTVEDDSKGYRLQRGESLVVHGDAPVGGVWRTARFMKNGELPGFVAADRLASEPPMDAEAELAGLGGIAIADASPEHLSDPAQLLSIRTQDVRLVTVDRRGEAVPASPISLVLSVADASYWVELPTCLHNQAGRPYDAFHGCLENMDCDFLDYRCVDQQCDVVTVAVSPTGETREAPAADGEPRTVPRMRLVALADRMGFFTPCRDD